MSPARGNHLTEAVLHRRDDGAPAFESAHRGDARPGIVVSVVTAGDLLQWHPHLHLITTDGGRNPDGSWHTPAEWEAGRLMRLFRERLLDSLLDKRAISQELVQKLLAWRHPGFSARGRAHRRL